MISACEKGKQPERALELLDGMISACEKGKQPERALELCDIDEQEDSVPDVITSVL